MEYLWLDTWAHDSSVHIGQNISSLEFWESLPCLSSIQNVAYTSAQLNRFLVVNSRLSHRGDLNTQMSCSAIVYPDPPSIGDFLRGARDYLLFPLLSAGATFLATGSPLMTGAAAAGRIISSEERRKI